MGKLDSQLVHIPTEGVAHEGSHARLAVGPQVAARAARVGRDFHAAQAVRLGRAHA